MYWLDNKKEYIMCRNGDKSECYYSKSEDLSYKKLPKKYEKCIGNNGEYKICKIGDEILIIKHRAKTVERSKGRMHGKDSFICTVYRLSKKS